MITRLLPDRDRRLSVRERLPALAGGLLRRFPECVAVALLATGLALAAAHDAIPEDWQDTALAAGLWCATAGPFLAGLRLLAEGWRMSPVRYAAAALAGAILLALWAWAGLGVDMEHWIAGFRFLLPAAGLIWALLVAPGLAPVGAGRGETGADAAYWHGVRLALGAFVAAALIVLLLAGGLSAALLGLEALLDLPVPDIAHADLWLLAGLLLLPCAWLALLPVLQRVADVAPADTPRILAAAIDLVLVPLALLYLAILYAYMALGALRWTLPDGTTAGLVAAYAAAGTAIWLAAAAPGHRGGRHVRAFRRLFFPALLLPLAMLAVALQIRIAAYGVTEPRYLLALLVLWMLGAALAQLLPRPRFGRFRLAIVPGLLCLLLALAAFGPWSARSVSQASQMARLETALSAAGLLRDGIIDTAAPAPGFKTRQQLSAILDYLAGTGKLAALDRWLPADAALPPDAERERAAAALGFAYLRSYMSEETARHVGLWSETPRPMSIAGFDSLLPFDLHAPESGAPGNDVLLLGGRRHRLFITADPPGLDLSDDEGRRVRFSLSEMMDRLDRDDGASDAPYIAAGQDRGLRARLVLRELSGRMEAQGPVLRNARGFILLTPAPPPAE